MYTGKWHMGSTELPQRVTGDSGGWKGVKGGWGVGGGGWGGGRGLIPYLFCPSRLWRAVSSPPPTARSTSSGPPAGQPEHQSIKISNPLSRFAIISSVLWIRDVYPGFRILIFTQPGSRISDPGSKNSNKREGWKKICCHTFFCSHEIHKIENYLIFEMPKKKILASFLRIIEPLTQNFVTNLSKIWVWDPGFGIRDLGSEIRDPVKTYSGSRIRVQGSKRHRIPDPKQCISCESRSSPCLYINQSRSAVYFSEFAIISCESRSSPCLSINQSRSAVYFSDSLSFHADPDQVHAWASINQDKQSTFQIRYHFTRIQIKSTPEPLSIKISNLVFRLECESRSSPCLSTNQSIKIRNPIFRFARYHFMRIQIKSMPEH